MSATPPALAVELRGVTVRYGEVVADREVSLTVAAGEVHAIVGENGAGKSTLMRALFGLVPLSDGEVRVRGERVPRPTPGELIGRGVGMVHQHFQLVPPLTAAENLMLGAEPLRHGLLDERRAERELAALAARHGLAVDPARPVSQLSVGERQRVEILKALHRGARTLILDEPTAVLTPPEVARLFAVLRGLREGGGSVLLVTHKLDEVQAVADRVTVLRRGRVVARFARAPSLDQEAMSPAAIARAMVGREPVPPPAREALPPGPVRLELAGIGVRGAGGLALGAVSLQLRGGEVLGIAGVEGNGQSELAAAIGGTVRLERGAITLDGREVTRLGPGRRRDLGLGQIADDRHRLGLLFARSIADNLLLGRERRFTRFGLVDRARLHADAAALLERFDVRPADPGQAVASLSGGNQQKLILARELSRDPGVLVAAQPTRGVDVGAREVIHRELMAVRRRGGGVLLLSAELDELRALSDRIAVLHRGRLVAVLDAAEATVERLGGLMTGADGDGVAA